MCGLHLSALPHLLQLLDLQFFRLPTAAPPYTFSLLSLTTSMTGPQSLAVWGTAILHSRPQWGQHRHGGTPLPPSLGSPVFFGADNLPQQAPHIGQYLARRETYFPWLVIPLVLGDSIPPGTKHTVRTLACRDTSSLRHVIPRHLGDKRPPSAALGATTAMAKKLVSVP